jgi:hypothetical protein
VVSAAKVGFEYSLTNASLRTKVSYRGKHPFVDRLKIVPKPLKSTQSLLGSGYKLKIGTNGLVRSLKSVFDYFVFYEVRLARRPLLAVTLWGLCLVLPVAIAVLGRRDWWLHPNWALLVYAGAVAKFSWNLVRSNAPRVGKFVINNRVREALKSAHAPEPEEQAGFKRRGGSVCLNRFLAFSKWFSALVTPPPLGALAC